MSRFNFEIVERIGVIADAGSGWSRELNVVAWNGGKPKLDIRDWSPEHDKMGKGITLTEEQGAKLAELLSERYSR